MFADDEADPLFPDPSGLDAPAVQGESQSSGLNDLSTFLHVAQTLAHFLGLDL